MSYNHNKKQRIFTLLLCGGICLIAFGAGLYDSEGQGISFALSAVMCLVGAGMLGAAVVFMHLKMRCPLCHRTFPLGGWWGYHCCPYCGEDFD